MSGFQPPDWWRQHCNRLFSVLIALMGTLALLKLGQEFYRLIWDPSPVGAVDLKHLHRWTGFWFAREPLFHLSSAALYPPATYLMLWPLLGWMSFSVARWFWAACFVLDMAAIIFLTVRISGAETTREKSFVALLLLSINGTGVSIGSGQLILQLLPALLACVLIMEEKSEAFRTDLTAAGLLTWGMIKPSVAAPFLWVFLFGWKRWRPVMLVLLLYAVLTLAAAAFQKEDLLTLLRLCLAKAAAATTDFPGTRNIHGLLVAVGLEKWMVLGSGIIFAGFGVWTYFHRSADRWVLMGIAAIVARMWTYHRSYDDVLILLPELALFRIAKQDASLGQRTVAGGLLALTALAMLFPARFLDRLEWDWAWEWIWLFAGIQTVLWLSLLAYLVHYACCDRNRSVRLKTQ
jgi:hypothetical protein